MIRNNLQIQHLTKNLYGLMSNYIPCITMDKLNFRTNLKYDEGRAKCDFRIVREKVVQYVITPNYPSIELARKNVRHH